MFALRYEHANYYVSAALIIIAINDEIKIPVNYNASFN